MRSIVSTRIPRSSASVLESIWGEEGESIMTETQERVISALKELVAEKPYAKITVHELCARADISRNTFYANFDDKEDVIRFVFETNVVQPIRDLNELLSNVDLEPLMNRINEQMYERLAADGEFFKRLIGPMHGHDDTFLRIVTQTIYRLNMALIPRITTLSKPWEIDYTAYFFASSQAMLMQKWVSDGMEVSPQELAGLYSSITRPFWISIAN